MKKIILMTKWEHNLLVCAKQRELCTKCKEINNCEEMTMHYDPYEDIGKCMQERRYKRGRRGAIQQR
jgi:hypothetical protein